MLGQTGEDVTWEMELRLVTVTRGFHTYSFHCSSFFGTLNLKP